MTSEKYTNQYDTSGTDQITTSGGPSNFAFLLAGAAIGAATALLFAPKAGSQLRQEIADVTRRGYDGAMDLTNRVKDESSNFSQRLLDKAENGIDRQADDVLSLGENETGNGPRRKSTDIV